MESTHIVHAFDKDLGKIEGLLLEMGGLVEAQINGATTALIHRDTEQAARIREGDKRIDALEGKINDQVVRLLALRQPMAEDLRITIAILKISANLERIGDYAKNIAKRIAVLVDVDQAVGASTNTLKRMSKLVQDMISDVLDAFIRRDSERANEIRRRDAEVDLMHNTLFRELLTYMMEDPRSITPCMHLLFIAKNLERAGDHTTAIAEQICYLVTGRLPDDKRPKSDTTSTMRVELKTGK